MTELVVVASDPTPPYEQLRRQLAALITTGALPAGARLPPLRQLAGDLGLAVGTVARTYRELESAGLVESRRGGGTSVATAVPVPAAADLLRLAAADFVHRALSTGATPAAIIAAVHRELGPPQ
ncbi:GntR family transcriptional regulator [Dactylosporangium sp. NPDC005555]|uniref:GntR family transcriptional regulator n=1 Tax=Dactylosporangium sp. NPDC005555 TaxID=3154889 RepID=UPI0033B1E060